MQIRFNLIYDDYVECQEFLERRIIRISGKKWIFSILGYLLYLFLALGVVSYYVFINDYNALNSYDFIYFNVLSAAALLTLYLFAKLSKRIIKKNFFFNNTACSTELTMSVNEETLDYDMLWSRKSYFWKYVRDVGYTKNLFIIIFDNYVALPIPKRIFDDPEKLQEFCAYVESKRTLKS